MQKNMCENIAALCLAEKFTPRFLTMTSIGSLMFTRKNL